VNVFVGFYYFQILMRNVSFGYFDFERLAAHGLNAQDFSVDLC
jgi:hypothetical protein